MGWGSAQPVRGRGSRMQMRIQPEIERNFANERTFWALRFLDPTGSASVGPCSSAFSLSGLVSGETPPATGIAPLQRPSRPADGEQQEVHRGENGAEAGNEASGVPDRWKASGRDHDSAELLIRHIVDRRKQLEELAEAGEKESNEH